MKVFALRKPSDIIRVHTSSIVVCTLALAICSPYEIIDRYVKIIGKADEFIDARLTLAGFVTAYRVLIGIHRNGKL